jgi:hypothetical protein
MMGMVAPSAPPKRQQEIRQQAEHGEAHPEDFALLTDARREIVERSFLPEPAEEVPKGVVSSGYQNSDSPRARHRLQNLMNPKRISFFSWTMVTT